MKKWFWFAGGILLGAVLTLGSLNIKTMVEEKRDAEELAQALEQGLTVSSYLDWPVRDDVILTMEHQVYPLGTDQVFALLENQSEECLRYGGAYTSFECYLAGQWYRIPVDYSTALLPTGLQVESMEDILLGDNIYPYEYDFPAGRYRLVFEYTYGPVWLSSNQIVDYVAFAEFEIRDGAALPEYGDIRKQSLRAKRAMVDGCLVFQDGEYINAEEMTLEILKTVRGVPGQLRIVDLDEEKISDVVIEWNEEKTKRSYTIITFKDDQVTTESLEDLEIWEGYEKLSAMVTETVE